MMPLRVMMMILTAVVVLVPMLNSMIVYGHVRRRNVRLRRMTAEVTDADEISELYGTMFTRDLTNAIVRARRRFARTVTWGMAIPVVWYLFASSYELYMAEPMLACLLTGNLAILIANSVVRMQLRKAKHIEGVANARKALSRYTFRQILMLAICLLLGLMMFG